MKKEFKVGDKVLIEGVVDKICGRSQHAYPIKVKLSKSDSYSDVTDLYFTDNGQLVSIDEKPQLMHAPEFEVGEEVEVRNELFGRYDRLLDGDINSLWNKRIFLFEYEGRSYCISDDDRNSFLNNTKAQLAIVQWNYARKIVKPEISLKDVAAAIQLLEDAGRLKDGKILT